MMHYLSWVDYVAEFCDLSDYPKEAKEALIDGTQRIIEHVKLRKCYENHLQNYNISHKREDITAWMEDIEKQAEFVELPFYTVKFLFFVLCTKHLKELYHNMGYPKSFFTGLLDDMKSKLMESYQVYKVWGTFVGGWYYKFFALERFAIGRLEYDLIQMPSCISLDGEYCFDGEIAVAIHIPSTGPLIKEQVRESMKDATNFFKSSFSNGKVLFVCPSWLLFPGHYKMISEKSGIRQFMEEFKIIHVDMDDTKRVLWRIFGTKDTQDLEELPRDTSLQRAYVDWLKEGRPIGDGLGIRYIKADTAQDCDIHESGHNT